MLAAAGWGSCGADESNEGSWESAVDAEVDGGRPMGGAVVPISVTACEAIIRAQCNKWAECSCTKGQGCREHPDCSEYYALCPEFQFSTGSTRTVRDLFACAEQLEKEDCETYFHKPIPSCLPAGTLPTGATCGFHSQCASLECVPSKDDVGCGTCAPVAVRGGPCPPPTLCPAGQYCNDSKVCEDLSLLKRGLPAGAACDAHSRTEKCARPLLCIQKVGSNTGTCLDRLPTVGEQCVTEDADPKSCASSEGPIHCSLSCDNAFCDTKRKLGGGCIAYLLVDAPCDVKFGTQCVPGSFCANGKCSLPSPPYALGDDVCFDPLDRAAIGEHCGSTKRCKALLHCDNGRCVNSGAACGTSH